MAIESKAESRAKSMSELPRNEVRVKVLVPHRLSGNIYVQELGRAYIDLGCEVTFGPENFFESNSHQDVIHMQWPEDLYRGYGDNSVTDRADRLLARLDEWKASRCNIALTIHNLKPHEMGEGDLDERVFQHVVRSADIIHHHCACSEQSIREHYAVSEESTAYVASHGNYFSYPNHSTRQESRDRLGIAESGFVYLHFGAIRGYKGLDQVMDAFNRVRQNEDVLLVAGRVTHPGSLTQRLQFRGHRMLTRSAMFNLGAVPTNEIQHYLNASDAMILGHKDGLNSGVAVLGMTFGLPVIGPALGCIEDVLKQGDNLVYKAGDYRGLSDRMREAKQLDLASVRLTNTAAASSWSWTDIASPVLRQFGFDSD